MNERPRYIAVEGPIGVGKTSLAELLAAGLGARLIREQPDENPFLASFYKDPKRHAMSAQLFFLLQRYQQQGELGQGDLFAQGGIVADYVFAKDRLFATLTLSNDELALYERIYQMLRPRVATPDLGRLSYRRGRPSCWIEFANAGDRPKSRYAPNTSRRLPGRTPSSSFTTTTARC